MARLKFFIALVTLLVAAPAHAGQTSFQVFGRIIDREQAAVAVWGVARPENGDFTALGTHTTDANILVLNPTIKTPPLYHERGLCLVGKDSGTNQFGAPVPVWIYAPCSETKK